VKKTLFVSLLLVFFCGNAETAKGVFVEGFRYWSSEQYTRVVIDLDAPTKYFQKRLSNPDRIYFDLTNSVLSKKATRSKPVKDGLLKGIRASQYNRTTVRVVLDLQEIASFNVFALKEPYRLVIDVYGDKKGIQPPFHETEKEKFLGIKRVVIDPGHGGRDPGAIGPRGVKEKEVVLDIAKKLGKVLRKKYNQKVFFTRTKDVFVSLEQRTAIANSKNADLFISIHVNANRQRNAKGIETYFLNWTNNEESNRVAARENAISYKKMKKVQNELQMILQDLERNNKKDESMKLAGNVQSAMINTLKQNYDSVVDLGVKHALFYVLVGARMQSILIEASFISNYSEERRLSDKTYRTKLAEGIAAGIQNYIESKRTIVKRTTSDKI
jgi:N-acetylmuramoyl-L-alanine amidase